MKKKIVAIMMALSLLAAIMTPMVSAASVSATKKGAALQFHQDGQLKNYDDLRHAGY